MNYYLFKILLLGNPTKETRAKVKGWFDITFKEDYKTTIGVGFYAKNVKYEEMNITLQIMEMFSEHGRFTYIRPMSFRGSLGALYIIDDTTTASFQDFDEWLPIMQYEVGNDLEGYTILLVLNINIEEESNRVENVLAEKSQWFNGYLKCNFDTGENVENIFQEITKLIMENFQRETPFGLRLKGESYIGKKQFNKAIECYKRALDLNPEYELVKKKLDQLEKQIRKKKMRSQK